MYASYKPRVITVDNGAFLLHRVHRRMFNVDQATFFLCSLLSTKQTYDWNSCFIPVFSLLWMEIFWKRYTLFDILLTILFALHKSASSRFCFRFHFHCQLHFFILLNKPFFRSCSFLQCIYKCSIFLLLLVGFLNDVKPKKNGVHLLQFFKFLTQCFHFMVHHCKCSQSFWV